MMFILVLISLFSTVLIHVVLGLSHFLFSTRQHMVSALYAIARLSVTRVDHRKQLKLGL